MKKTFLFFLFFTFTIHSQWLRVSNGFGTNKPVLALSANGNKIFAGIYLFGNGGVYLSTNNGISWTQTSLINRDIYSLTVKDNIVFAGTEGNGIYSSTNNGLNWLQTSFNTHTFSSLSTRGNYIFAGTYFFGNGGVFLSTNNGLNWIQSSLNNLEVIATISNDNYIFAGTISGVFRSTNNGTNWEQTILNYRSVYALAVNGNIIYAGTDGNGVYKSTNNGTTWSQTSLNNQYVRSLAVSNNNVFAGIYSSPSFFVSTNSGNSWTQKNDGFLDPEYLSVRSLLISGNYLFAGTSNSIYDGVYRRPIGELVGTLPISTAMPEQFSLSQNYPNPFNPSTKIKFDISGKSVAQTFLSVYDILGREVAVLVNEELRPGTYEVDFDGSGFTSGVYFYKLISADFSETKRMVLIK